MRHLLRRLGWWALICGFCPAGVMAADWVDDFETGTLLSTEIPAGRWSQLTTVAPNQMVAASEAAHRGQWGLRLTDVAALAGAGGESDIRWDSEQTGPEVWVRFWFRMLPTQPLGQIHLVRLGTPSFLPLLELVITPSGTLILAGDDATAMAYTSVQSTGHHLGQTWHLFELAVLGLGTSNGQRRAWLDGLPLVSQEGISWTALGFGHLALGAPYSDDRSFTGTLDFDDVRVSATPPAAAWDMVLDDGPVQARSCLPVRVRLVDSATGAAQPAPYDVEVTGLVSAEAGWFSTSPDCTNAQPTWVVPAGARETTVYLWLREEGSASVSLSDLDFLPVQRSITAGPYGHRVLTVSCATSGGEALLPTLTLAALLGLWCPSTHRRRMRKWH